MQMKWRWSQNQMAEATKAVKSFETAVSNSMAPHTSNEWQFSLKRNTLGKPLLIIINCEHSPAWKENYKEMLTHFIRLGTYFFSCVQITVMCSQLAHCNTTSVGGHPHDHGLLCWDHEAINLSGPVSWNFPRPKPSQILRHIIPYVLCCSVPFSFVVMLLVLNSGIDHTQRSAVGQVAASSVNGTVKSATKPPDKGQGSVKFHSNFFEVMKGVTLWGRTDFSTSVSRVTTSTQGITHGACLRFLWHKHIPYILAVLPGSFSFLFLFFLSFSVSQIFQSHILQIFISRDGFNSCLLPVTWTWLF
jgi:hypothetical protein